MNQELIKRAIKSNFSTVENKLHEGLFYHEEKFQDEEDSESPLFADAVFVVLMSEYGYTNDEIANEMGIVGRFNISDYSKVISNCDMKRLHNKLMLCRNYIELHQ